MWSILITYYCADYIQRSDERDTGVRTLDRADAEIVARRRADWEFERGTLATCRAVPLPVVLLPLE